MYLLFKRITHHSIGTGLIEYNLFLRVTLQNLSPYFQCINSSFTFSTDAVTYLPGSLQIWIRPCGMYFNLIIAATPMVDHSLGCNEMHDLTGSHSWANSTLQSAKRQLLKHIQECRIWLLLLPNQHPLPSFSFFQNKSSPTLGQRILSPLWLLLPISSSNLYDHTLYYSLWSENDVSLLLFKSKSSSFFFSLLPANFLETFCINNSLFPVSSSSPSFLTLGHLPIKCF